MSIRVEKLHKKFNRHAAVEEATFAVGDGEFVTLLGPSGSGKSTVLRSIAGLEKPDGGTIEINKQDVTNVPVQERKIGFVFQHYALFRHMTILENIAFGLRVRGVDKISREKKAAELIELVGLGGLERRYPTQLSGGQRQRVALARALAPEPGLLLLDEPFGALDTRLRKELRSWLKSLHDRIGLTTLMVTHDQEEAFELSDRVLIMNHGRIEQDATPQKIFDEPATEFVATFVGETNAIEGKVSEGVVGWGPFRFKALHLKAGAVARVLFRPNDVYVTSKREEGGWPGVITATQFLGPTVSLEIDMGEGCQLTAHVPKGIAAQSDFVVKKNVHVMITAAHVFSA